LINWKKKGRRWWRNKFRACLSKKKEKKFRAWSLAYNMVKQHYQSL